MTFDLKSIQPTKRNTPYRMLLHGAHKIGKTTFAAGAPGAIFIATEDGQDAIDTQAFPLCQSWDDIHSAMSVLYNDSHDYKTIVLDSADWAERLCHTHVCATIKPKNGTAKNIEDYGYGKGYVFAADVWGELLAGMNAIRLQRDMNVILIAHSEIKRFDDPLADSYDRYQIKMHKLVGKLCQEWSDIIGFAQLDTLTTTENVGFDSKKTRALDGGRVLRLVASPAYDAGNRFGLPATLDLSYAAFDAAMKARDSDG